jgi:hypothetical protein
MVAWLDRRSGGWQVLFPSAGDACVHGGVELDYHGEAAVSPWRCEVLGDSRCAAATLEVVLAHSPFRLLRRLRLAEGSSEGEPPVIERQVRDIQARLDQLAPAASEAARLRQALDALRGLEQG